MEHQILAWMRRNYNQKRHETWLESLWILGLLLAALVLLLTQLGNLPLRDWDEGTVAQVAKEIWQASPGEQRWLFPTLWGEPYLNKPPLVHGLIALTYSLGGVNEWTTRLPGATLTAISVPLLYALGREIFPSRAPAIFSALIYLTFIPVVRHGRLAMLDGVVLCFTILMMWCVVRTRRDLRWALGVGISFGLICLTKGIVGLLIGAIALLFIAWDTPRLLTSFYLWCGILFGSIPVFAWYTAQWLHYPQDFLETGIWEQSLQRIFAPVENHQGVPWYYLLEILKYSSPWLIFFIPGIRQAWNNRNWSWSKLILVWSTVYLLAVSLMATKLPWYILPIYPALALAGGAQITQVYALPASHPYPRFWSVALAILGIATGGGCIYFAFANNGDSSVSIILASVALTMGVSAVLIERRDEQFILMLFWGMYVSLLLFISSPHWLWELNEAYSVKEVAAVIRLSTPVEQRIYTSFDYERPSLNFYSERQILPPPFEVIQEMKNQSPDSTSQQLKLEWLKNYWQQENPAYLLIQKQELDNLNLESVTVLGNALHHWVLITQNND